MYDTVIATCKCGCIIEFQSKAGECEFRYYPIDAVPAEIARDLKGQSEVCPKCGIEYMLKGKVKKIKMELVSVSSE